MNKINLLLLATTVLAPCFVQADDLPTEPNLCAAPAVGAANFIQAYIPGLCDSGLAMKQAIANSQQQDSSPGPVGAAGGLGSWFGGGNKSAAPAANSNTAPSTPSIYK